MGGPSTLDQVEPFLLELFGDNDLISVPFPSVLQKFVAEKIARKRTPDIHQNMQK
jgi:ferrochelatase